MHRLTAILTLSQVWLWPFIILLPSTLKRTFQSLSASPRPERSWVLFHPRKWRGCHRRSAWLSIPSSTSQRHLLAEALTKLPINISAFQLSHTDCTDRKSRVGQAGMALRERWLKSHFSSLGGLECSAYSASCQCHFQYLSPVQFNTPLKMCIPSAASRCWILKLNEKSQRLFYLLLRIFFSVM